MVTPSKNLRKITKVLSLSSRALRIHLFLGCLHFLCCFDNRECFWFKSFQFFCVLLVSVTQKWCCKCKFPRILCVSKMQPKAELGMYRTESFCGEFSQQKKSEKINFLFPMKRCCNVLFVFENFNSTGHFFYFHFS